MSKSGQFLKLESANLGFFPKMGENTVNLLG